jgi:predicted 3-demethylubiquinone-9 3-methyltransferase (glyoxalase superfamily)
MQKVTPFLWFNGRIQEALDLYTSVFPSSRVLAKQPGPNGELQGATIEIEGQQLIAFNGGPGPQLTPAFSLFVNCESQTEIDELWARLTADGGQESRCGWLQDRFGVSWQIIPSILPQLLSDPDRERAGRVLNAMLQMQKIDIGALERAAAGEIGVSA